MASVIFVREFLMSGRYASFADAVLRTALCLLLLGCAMTTAARADPVRILALGDSLTAGYGLPAADSFTVQLQARAACRRPRRDRDQDGGVSGDTTAGGLARLDWALADEPDMVIVELGANDMLRGIDPASARANLDAILTELDKRGLPVLLAGMKAARNLGRDYVDAFDSMYPDLAAGHGCLLYPFFLDGVAGDPSLNQADGMHPNAQGVAIIVKAMLPKVEALIDEAGKGS